MSASWPDEGPAAEASPGGGTGGGPGNEDRHVFADGTYTVCANQVHLAGVPPAPPAIPGECVVTIRAAGAKGDGLVDVRGSKAVRLSAGPPALPPPGSETPDGIDILAGQTSSVKVVRGLLPTDQRIELTPGGITIDAGAMGVTIKSLSSIELSVAGGVTKLRLGPEGVTIEALTIKLSAQLQAQIDALLTTLSSTAVTRVSGGITMIG